MTDASLQLHAGTVLLAYVVSKVTVPCLDLFYRDLSNRGAQRGSCYYQISADGNNLLSHSSLIGVCVKAPFPYLKNRDNVSSQFS